MNSVSVKRINKELEYFSNKKYKLDNLFTQEYNFYDKMIISTYFITDQYNNDVKNLNIEIIKNNKILKKFKFPIYYPFKPLNIITHNFSTLNWSKYLNVLYENVKAKNNNTLLYFFYIIQYGRKPIFLNDSNNDNNKHINCFCCSSYNCPYWNPGLKLKVVYKYMEVEFINKYTKIIIINVNKYL